MSNIKISDLSSNGSDLLEDSESFLQDLGDQQLFSIQGGSSVISQVTVGVGLLMVQEPIATYDTAASSTSLAPTDPTAVVILA